jgi:hypothetical protein
MCRTTPRRQEPPLDLIIHARWRRRPFLAFVPHRVSSFPHQPNVPRDPKEAEFLGPELIDSIFTFGASDYSPVLRRRRFYAGAYLSSFMDLQATVNLAPWSASTYNAAM